MAEDIIFKIEIDEGSALADAARSKEAILRLKEEVKLLDKAYKDKNITRKELAQESVRLDALLKREQTNYNNLTKSMSGTKTQTDKLVAALKENTAQLNIMGVNVGNVQQKLGSMNKTQIAVGATFGIATVAAGALAAAYARSAEGAEDLATAGNNVKAMLDILSNSVGNATGGGWLTNLSDELSRFLIIQTGESNEEIRRQLKLLDTAQEQLEIQRKFEELRIDAQANNKKALKEAEEARRIRDDADKTYLERLEAVSKVEEKIKESETSRTDVIRKNIVSILKYNESVGGIKQGTTAIYENFRLIDFNNVKSLGVRIQLKNLLREYADIQEEVSGKVTENQKAEQGIVKEAKAKADAREKELIALRAATSEIERQARIAQREREITNGERKLGGGLAQDLASFFQNRYGDTALQQLREGTNTAVEIQSEALESLAKTEKVLADRIVKIHRDKNGRIIEINEAGVRSEMMKQQAIADLTFDGLRLLDVAEQTGKASALGMIAIDTAQAISGLVRSSETNPLNGPTSGAAGILQFAAGILRIGANIGQAYKLLGASGPSLNAYGGSNPTFTDTSGNQYEIIDGEAVPIDEQGQRVPRTALGRVVRTGRNLRSRFRNWSRELRRSVFGFSEGGYTGDGHTQQVKGVVHAQEVVWNARDVAAVGGPEAANAMRPTFKGYRDGGIVGNNISSPVYANMDLMNLVKNLPAPIVSWVEGRDMGRKVQFKEMISGA